MRASDKKNNSKAGIEVEEKVSLTSLMDIMTIILLFLIQSFSTDGNLIKKDADNELTVSRADRKAGRMSSVIITPQQIKFKPSVDKDVIEMYTTDITDELINDSTIVNIPNLMEGLKIVAEEKELLAKEMQKQEIDEGVIAEQVKWELIVEADKNTSFKIVTKVLQTCGAAGFSDIKLLTLGE